ncbi:MAG TPA: S53 family peptidase [Gammaproteobacteria bacterium]|nr:S53 family peptidase [Gammaproteobacteria bacterium]
MRTLRKQALAFALASALIAPAVLAGAPYPTRETPKAVDLGTPSSERNATVTVTVALKLRNSDEMMSLMQGLYTKGNVQYHHFLSTADFQARFAPTVVTINSAMEQFRAQGLTVTRLSSNLLSVSGSQAAIEKAFSVSLHTFEVPANGKSAGYRFHAPTTAPQMAPSLAANVEGVLGLDNRPHYRPHIQRIPDGLKQHLSPKRLQPAAGAPNTPDQPGLWTVTDFADYYDVNPLYSQGINGRHTTVGIVTLASFTPSDAFTYWNALGLATDPNRITVVNVDGGPGAPSDASGSDETTLDVQQSGGVAPGAKIIVYQSPNTDQGFVDAFAQAIDSNQADSISCSWGEWEIFPDQNSVTDPNNGRTESSLATFNDLFIQAALQGQSLYSSAGDAGAYDANRIFPLPQFSAVISVDNPADEPFMTAAGGTTLPGPQLFLLPDNSIFTVNINQEQAWGWDYLTNLCATLGFDPVSCGIFPGGTGGGVSSFVKTPFYQFFIPGIQRTQRDQALVDNSQTPPQTLATLPGNFRGRNLPDVSFNADPDTGYIIPYTSSQQGFIVLTFIGGTSFVAPQLNGVTALLDQSVHGRVGLLNFALYDLVRFGAGYGGKHPPLRDITAGDNWFYQAHPGYDQATGVGVPDVANLARVFQEDDQ